jgi:hypothetical protein
VFYPALGERQYNSFKIEICFLSTSLKLKEKTRKVVVAQVNFADKMISKWELRILPSWDETGIWHSTPPDPSLQTPPKLCPPQPMEATGGRFTFYPLRELLGEDRSARRKLIS